MAERADVIVVGHKGLVAAVLLARAGLSVRVVKDKDAIMGKTGAGTDRNRIERE